ncbi:nitrite/sulfite reductase [Anaerostipes sp.]|uniref:nitrite/sulfite reductase n=1 Tax=Anaerostipes sp. TaxID=1872530 RepID=UPI0025C6E87F|nr:nitrite/sulfite reductase [Anaerostipes sp.]MBS7007989.1 nitrite/sulfite reductase [Anaerostipes sp.]
MNQELKKEFQSDLAEFHLMTRKFYQKEVSVKDYKSFSGGFGSYAQRGGGSSMLRLRFTGGEITKDKLQFIADSVRKYEINKLHLTTCQSVQVHNLSDVTVSSLIEESFEHDIITRGGGGDFPRNVMVSPLSGVEKGEYFDVLPYAKEAADYLLTFIKKVKMPRKLKVCFSNSPKNETHATFRDLGFVACEDHTFEVYSAGGLGNNAKMGVLIDKHVDPSKVLYYIKAMMMTFTEHGNYKNRGKARTRYMQDTLGREGYRDAFLSNLKKAMETESLDLDVQETPVTKEGDGTLEESFRITAQKQDGLYSVLYHPFGGNVPPELIAPINEAVQKMDQVVLRVAPDESLYFINCTRDEALELLALTKDSASNLFETSVACIGSGICQVGLRDSQKLYNTIMNKIRPLDFPDGTLPRIHISGCPSSCGTHQIGTLGFRGATKVIDKKPHSAFQLYIGGSDIQGEETFGEDAGTILEADIPEFLKEIGLTVQEAHTTYADWIKQNPEELQNIVQKYVK